MILVTQGHENSISIEVFLKSFLLLSPPEQKNILFFVFKESLEKTLNLLKLNYTFSNKSVLIGQSLLKCSFLEKVAVPESSVALIEAIKFINNEKDILLTLPTSKDQLYFERKLVKGHTEFLRSYFKKENLSMVFSANNENILLISDHIPLSQVSKFIKSNVIIEKVSDSIVYFKQYFGPITEVFISGLNPHAGENGLLGEEEQEIQTAIANLKDIFPHIKFEGPIPGDGIHLKKTKKEAHQLYVYMYHDQGLSPFKQKHGLVGLHMTFGLPFLRMSVDHGTGFDIYGKRKANPIGCYHLLKKSLNIQNKLL
tara:strand:+ start:1454 stop:2389 length:936 start_codon:yes stop_codon:yes gene_type:complete